MHSCCAHVIKSILECGFLNTTKQNHIEEMGTITSEFLIKLGGHVTDDKGFCPAWKELYKVIIQTVIKSRKDSLASILSID